MDDKASLVAGAEMLAPLGTTKGKDIATSGSGTKALAAVGVARGKDGKA
jgi:hypothetical protein